MTIDYIVYANYDPNARTETSIQKYLQGRFFRLERMLEFLNQDHTELIGRFIEILEKKLADGMSNSENTTSIDEFQTLASKYPLLNMNLTLVDSTIRFMINQLDLPESYNPEMKNVEVLLLNVEKGENLISYYAIQSMTDIMGREDGIQLYKDFVDFLAKNPPHQEIKDFRNAREKWVSGMANSGGFAFAVHDFDENKFLAKFDKCVVYDSLKNMGDAEFGYLVTCYTGCAVAQQRDWCVRMRRSQTLFTKDFCDELYWNRHVHDEPEQPSLEFSRKLVVE